MTRLPRDPVLSVAAGEGALDANGQSGDAEPACINAVYSLQKLASLLEGGDDDQIEFALGELEQLFHNCLEDASLMVVPAVCENMTSWTQDLQLLAGKKLVMLKGVSLNKELARVISFAALLVIRDTNNITMEKATEIYSTFSDVASFSMPYARWSNEDTGTLLRFIDQYAQSPFADDRKVAVSFTQGLCGSHPQGRKSTHTISQEGFRRLWKMAQDPSLDVICQCFNAIGACADFLSESDIDQRLWKLVDKVWSSNVETTASATELQARKASIECFAKISTSIMSRDTATLSKGFQKSFLPQLVSRAIKFTDFWCAQDQRDVSKDVYNTSAAFSEHFGQFVAHLYSETRPSAFTRSIVAALRQMATCNGPSIRENCARNLPGILDSLPVEKHTADSLAKIVEGLSGDADERVRLRISKGFHETVKRIPNKSWSRSITFVVQRLLQDQKVAIREALIGNISSIIQTMACDMKVGEIAGAVSALLETIPDALAGGAWRLGEEFSQQAVLISSVFPDTATADKLVGILMDLLLPSRPFEVLQAASNSILSISRNVASSDHRDKYVQDLMSKLWDGNPRMRVVAIEVSVHGLEVFSEVLFNRLLATPTLRAAHDDVPNVRLCLARRLHALVPWCQGHELFQTALERLQQDHDPDVKATMLYFVTKASACVREAKSREAEYAKRRVDEIVHYSCNVHNDPNEPVPKLLSTGSGWFGAIERARSSGSLDRASQNYGKLNKPVVALRIWNSKQKGGPSGSAPKSGIEEDTIPGTSGQVKAVSAAESDVDYHTLGNAVSMMTWSNESNSRSRSRFTEFEGSAPAAEVLGNDTKFAEPDLSYSDISPSVTFSSRSKNAYQAPSWSSHSPNDSLSPIVSHWKPQDAEVPSASGVKTSESPTARRAIISAQALPVQKVAKKLTTRRVPVSSPSEEPRVSADSQGQHLGPQIRRADSSEQGRAILESDTKGNSDPPHGRNVGQLDNHHKPAIWHRKISGRLSFAKGIFRKQAQHQDSRGDLESERSQDMEPGRSLRRALQQGRRGVFAPGQGRREQKRSEGNESQSSEAIDPSSYVPQFKGSPPWARRLTEKNTSATASSSHELSDAEGRENHRTHEMESDRLDGRDLVAPGTVSSLLKRWEALASA